MKVARWIVLNGLFLLLIVFGLIHPIFSQSVTDSLANVAYFFTWFSAVSMVIFGIARASDDEIKEKMAAARSVSPGIDFAFDVVVAALFASLGNFWLAGLYLIGSATMNAEKS